MTLNTKNQKIKATILLVTFWILIGLSSGLLYNLEWFIQKVVFFNKWVSSSESVKKLGLSGDDINQALSKINWNSLDVFYNNLEAYVEDKNSNPQFEPYYTIYDQLMKKAMRDEGLIFSISGLFAAFVSGPFLVSFVNKKKSYKIFALPVIFVFGFLILAVAPWLSSAILMYAIFCPIFGIGYGYRTLMDPWGTTVSRKTNVAIGFVRSFYEIGSALGTFFLTFYLFKANYYKQTLTIQTAVPYFVSGLAVLSLGIFLFFYMPDNVFASSHIEDKKYGEKVEESNILNKQIKLKDIVFSRGFIIGLIGFIFLIGPIQAFNSIWVNTVENFTTEQNVINNVDHIGYQKLFSVVFRLIFAFLILKRINKFKLKNIIMFASLLAGLSWITIGSLVYNIKLDKDKMILVDLIGALAESLIAALSVALGYEFVSRYTTIKTRSISFVIFNSITYGLGGIIFVGFNTFLSRVAIPEISFGPGQIVWIIMGLMSIISFLIIVFLWTKPKFKTYEYDENILK